MSTASFIRNSLVSLVALVCIAVAGGAHAQAGYPNKPVKLVVPFAAGGSTTLLARMLTERLGQSMGQPFVIDNRAGAGGNVGMEYVARSEPDGYTLLLAPIGMATNPALYPKMSFDPQKDFAPISLYAGVPNLLVVHPSVPARNIGELIAYAKAHPGKLTYASSGVGTSSHLTAEMLKSAAGIFILHIPYRGGAPAMQDLMGGQVHMLFEQVPSVLPEVQSGRVRALGITSTRRMPTAPEIPTVAESLAGFEVNAWMGIAAPKGTSPQIVARLNAEIVKVLNDPAFQAQLARVGATAMPSSPTDYAKFLASETTRWTRIVKASGARLD
ncbi:Tripartite-type tricarboxylate transporter, receptor component TctC [Polaromonas sp. YR568]|uniref:Bug family tripartite tricarboxylate transporter substrate binding protein n=1 Tax=Polaromonas sp. YR568 TaxID=1855301 RepID=UPI0008E3C6A5|nr:tripartite tricarboxylate transporter substrate binding protein [Polaromonas sp. YR568]SFU89564.1 Tripartite-type tricarboxylate transporter, receptor component TctC [Polaromonas sp. YR568]